MAARCLVTQHFSLLTHAVEAVGPSASDEWRSNNDHSWRVEWLDQVALQIAEIRTAHYACLIEGDVDLAIRIAMKFSPYWELRGPLWEGPVMFKEMHTVGTTVPLPVAVFGWGWLGRFAYRRGNLCEAGRCYEQVRQLIDGVPECWLSTVTKQRRAQIALGQGDYETAQQLSANAMAAGREQDWPWVMAEALATMGLAARQSGDAHNAEVYLQQSLGIATYIGNRTQMADALQGQGLSAADLLQHERAAALFRETLQIRCELTDRVGMPDLLEGIARAEGMGGRRELAVQLLAAAATERKGSGAGLAPCDLADYDQLTDELRDALGPARYRTAWDEGGGISLDEAVLLAQSSPHGA